MLTDVERAALERWYSQQHIVDKAKELADAKNWGPLEEHLHRFCLMPLGKHESLPDYLLDDEGKPLFPTNLNPGVDKEKWRDAVEVAWAVMEQKLGLSHDDVHRHIANDQQSDWDAFIKSVDQRKKERGES